MTCHQYVPLSRAMQNMQLYNTHSVLIFSGIPASNKTTEAEGTAQFTGLLNIEISSQLHFNCSFREIYWSKLVTWLMVAVKFLFLKQDYLLNIFCIQQRIFQNSFSRKCLTRPIFRNHWSWRSDCSAGSCLRCRSERGQSCFLQIPLQIHPQILHLHRRTEERS